jgi:hypothetical protein
VILQGTPRHVRVKAFMALHRAPERLRFHGEATPRHHRRVVVEQFLRNDVARGDRNGIVVRSVHGETRSIEHGVSCTEEHVGESGAIGSATSNCCRHPLTTRH